MDTSKIIPDKSQTDYTQMFALSEKLIALYGEKEDQTAILKTINRDIDTAEYKLTTAMTDSETPNFTHTGKQFVLTMYNYASSNAETSEELFQALRENGLGDIILEKVHPKTLAATVRSLIADNDSDIPEWLTGKIKVFTKAGITVRKPTTRR
ncbi:hypothetical protein FACS1894105_10660 [Clostridia bacterium]|nr:hypothetical protein FACS1894105_10660 [Clostridia bacterium]